MFGICFFDLVPDVFELGGNSSLYVMGAVWLLYSVMHILHLGHHHHEDEDSETHPTSKFLFFVASLVAHCFAGRDAVDRVLWPLQADRADCVCGLGGPQDYESLLLSSILLSQRRLGLLWRNGVIGVYALALPAGAAVTVFFQGAINQQVAIWISSIAVGTLLGCLIFDFLSAKRSATAGASL